MLAQPEIKIPLALLIGYIDLGTGQTIVSSLGPILAGAGAFLIGIFSFFLVRFKKVFKNLFAKNKKKTKGKKKENKKSKEK